MTSIEELVRLAENSRQGQMEVRQGFVAVLWMQSPTDLERLSIRFAEIQMLNLRDVCRVIASIKRADLTAPAPVPDARTTPKSPRART